MLYENMLNWNIAIGKPTSTNTTNISDTWHVVWAQPSIIELIKTNIRGMDVAIQQNKDQQVDSGMVAAIQSDESCNES